MKLCIDCKHVADKRSSLPECKSPKNVTPPDVVTGKKAVRWDFCRSHREDGIFWSYVFKTCGKRGRWFEVATHQPAAHASNSTEVSCDAES